MLAVINAEFTLKRLKIVDGKPELQPENSAADYPVIHFAEFDNFSIEGVLIGSDANIIGTETRTYQWQIRIGRQQAFSFKPYAKA